MLAGVVWVASAGGGRRRFGHVDARGSLLLRPSGAGGRVRLPVWTPVKRADSKRRCLDDDQGGQMISRAEQLAMALDEFVQSSPEIEAAAIVSMDGLPMASALPPEIEEDRLGAMAAALLSLGEKAAEGLGRGDLAQIFVEGEYGFVFLMAAGETSVLTAITRPSGKIGLILYEMRHTAARIANILEQPSVVQMPGVRPAAEQLG